MISFIHQGGGCQEAANLRVEANNVMIGAMMAPRPLMMVSASGDWTQNTPREEFPALQVITGFLMLKSEWRVAETPFRADQVQDLLAELFYARICPTSEGRDF
jgi:hypothetical protein